MAGLMTVYEYISELANWRSHGALFPLHSIQLVTYRVIDLAAQFSNDNTKEEVQTQRNSNSATDLKLTHCRVG